MLFVEHLIRDLLISAFEKAGAPAMNNCAEPLLQYCKYFRSLLSFSATLYQGMWQREGSSHCSDWQFEAGSGGRTPQSDLPRSVC